MVWNEDDGEEIHRFADGTVVQGATLVAADQGGGLPEGVGADLLARWYGEARESNQTFRFAPDQSLCRLWLGLGRFPRLEWVGTLESGGTSRTRTAR